MSRIAGTQELCKVTFDRQAGRYNVRNGKLLATYPAGPEGERQAKLAAIAHDDQFLGEALGHLIEKLGHVDGLTERAITGARLALEGKVTGRRVDGHTNHNNLANFCDCPDHDAGNRRRFGYTDEGAPVIKDLGGIVCAHTLARHLEQEANKRRAFARALAPDPANRKRDNRFQFKVKYGGR